MRHGTGDLVDNGIGGIRARTCRVGGHAGIERNQCRLGGSIGWRTHRTRGTGEKRTCAQRAENFRSERNMEETKEDVVLQGDEWMCVKDGNSFLVELSQESVVLKLNKDGCRDT